MAEEGSEPVDIWGVMEEARQTVERWPDWQQQYEADVYYEPGDDPPAAG